MVSRRFSIIILILTSIGVPTGLIFLWIYEILPYEIVIGLVSFLMLGVIAFAVKYLPTMAPASSSQLELLIRSGNYNRAIEFLSNKLGRKKKNKKALLNLGLVYSLNSEYEKSIETLDRLLELRPHDPVTLYNLSKVYNDQGKYEKVIDILTKLVSENSRDFPKRNYELWFEIAEIYRQKGDLLKAHEWVDKTLELRPNFRDALRLRDEVQSSIDGDVLD